MQDPSNEDFKCFDEISTVALNQRKFPVYIIDYNWNYLFANNVAKSNLDGIQIEGKNVKDLWA
jgi:hypothetical protein